MAAPSGGEPHAVRNGVVSVVVAYFVWGFFPIFFRLLDGVPPELIVAHRTIWSLVFVFFVLVFHGRLGEVWSVFRSWKRFAIISTSTVILACNWLVFIWAVDNDRVLDASLGYFITPLVSVALGMIFLGERQNKWQMISIVIAVLGVGVQGVWLGSLPWVAICLALSFGIYGFLRKTVSLGSAPGLMAETLIATPAALAFVIYTIATRGTGPHTDPSMMALLIFSGPMTATVLIFFAYGAKRLRLTTVGMFQYITPSMHFVVAIWLFKEPLQPVVLISFVLIWISLTIFTLDSLRRGKKRDHLGDV